MGRCWIVYILGGDTGKDGQHYSIVIVIITNILPDFISGAGEEGLRYCYLLIGAGKEGLGQDHRFFSLRDPLLTKLSGGATL